MFAPIISKAVVVPKLAVCPLIIVHSYTYPHPKGMSQALGMTQPKPSGVDQDNIIHTSLQA